MNKLKSDLRANMYCSVFEYKRVPSKNFYKDAGQGVVNPYQKPIRLYVRLLKMFAAPGAVVLDCTMGSGSLELAAMESGVPSDLHILAFEKNEYQMTHAHKRLTSAVSKPSTSVPLELDALEEEYTEKGFNLV